MSNEYDVVSLQTVLTILNNNNNHVEPIRVYTVPELISVANNMHHDSL